jgi:hypothetical protein
VIGGAAELRLGERFYVKDLFSSSVVSSGSSLEF